MYMRGVIYIPLSAHKNMKFILNFSLAFPEEVLLLIEYTKEGADRMDTSKIAGSIPS